MPRQIVINAGISEARVAVLDGGVLTDLALERKRHRSIVGNIYKGVVTNVLPGMQAAFVDVGLMKDAFLYAGDFTINVGDYERLMLTEDEADADIDLEEAEEPPERERREIPPIEDVLRKGQEILVQVSKESLGTKGARITSFISLPGRYLVYMPQVNHVGVSRRIRDAAERDRLRRMVKALRPAAGGGFIIRTVGEGRGEEEFKADIEFLVRLWQQVQARFAQAPARAPLHEEGDLIFRVVRDLFTAEVEEILIDAEDEYRRAVEYAESLVPALAHRVHLYEGREPVFEARGIEREIEKAVRRKVWLKSGGYLVIDQTEALVSIDVNTGKYVGKRDFEETILKINLEAVNEVVRQIRLRDLGGIIIIDFIDMEAAEHREQVYRALKRALAEDKARTNVLEISELGLVEMTRKRVRQDLRALLSTQCPTCKGSGVTKSDETLTAELFRAIRAKAAAAPGKDIVARVHPDLAGHLDVGARDDLARLAGVVGSQVTVEAFRQPKAREDYELIVR
jgi:ribonuclease G